MRTVAEEYLDSIKQVFGYEIDKDAAALILRKLSDKSAPTNMNLFSSFTPEEREMLIIHDKLGGVKIQQLVETFGDHRFPPQFRNEISFIEELVSQIITPKYLGQFARKEGYFDRPEVIVEGKRSLDNAILPAIEKEMVYDKGNPTEAEMKSYYDKNLAKFTRAETRTGFEIMVDDKQLANDLLGRIKKGEDISSLARRYTMRAKVKGLGGRLGPFSKDEFGNVSRKAFEMKVGELAGPFEADPKTWSIFKLTEIQPAQTQGFAEVQKQIESDVRFQTQKEIREKWMTELIKAYDLKINDAMVKAVWPIVEPLPQAVAAERKKMKDQREEAAKRRSAEDRIKLQLKPNSEQEFTTKEGKKVQVKIGEPRYMDKSGKPIDPSKSSVKLTPQGKFESKDDAKGSKPTIRLQPKAPPPSGNPATPPSTR
jgi:hypothetical protein